MVDLVQMGKVRYIGASSMFTYQFLGLQYVAEKNGWTKFISMQNYYNLIYREEEREMNPACKELGVGYPPTTHSPPQFVASLLVVVSVLMVDLSRGVPWREVPWPDQLEQLPSVPRRSGSNDLNPPQK
jgi:hypothetical protein